MRQRDRVERPERVLAGRRHVKRRVRHGSPEPRVGVEADRLNGDCERQSEKRGEETLRRLPVGSVPEDQRTALPLGAGPRGMHRREERSTATVSKGHVTVHMMKAVRGNWDGLCLTLNAKNKDEVLERRRRSIERAYEKAEARRRERQALHEKEKKDAQDRSFELDKRKRRAIDEAKEKELTSAREEISRFAFAQETSATTSRVTFADSDLEDELDIDEVDSERIVEEKEEEEEIIVLPPPRQTLPSVAVEFTPTIVETLPAREGREEELKLIRKSQGGGDSDNASDTDLAERHPAFLKDKGDKMCKHGNYRGALQAYCRALDIDPNHLLCLCNRSMCYLRLGQPSQAEEDCRRAMDMVAKQCEDFDPTLPSEEQNMDKMNRLKLIGRLAKALAAQGKTKEVIKELERALALSISYPGIKESIERDLSDTLECVKVSLEDLCVSSDMEDVKPRVESMKKIGDTRIKQRDPKGALKVYSQIVDLIHDLESKTNQENQSLEIRDFLFEMKLACFSNSASGHLMLGDFLSSIADCERVIFEVAARFDLDYYLFKENANTKDEGLVQGLKGVLEQILDVAKSGEDRLLQVKKYMSSLIRALRKLSSAFSHLKDYAVGLKILELGLTAQSHMRRRK